MLAYLERLIVHTFSPMVSELDWRLSFPYQIAFQKVRTKMSTMVRRISSRVRSTRESPSLPMFSLTFLSSSMFSWLFFGPMLSRYDHSSPYFSIVTYIIPTLLGRLRHLPFVQKMLDNALIYEVCMREPKPRTEEGSASLFFFLSRLIVFSRNGVEKCLNFISILFLDSSNLSMLKWLSFLPCHHFDVLLPFYPPGAYTGTGRGLYLLQQQQQQQQGSSAKVYLFATVARGNFSGAARDICVERTAGEDFRCFTFSFVFSSTTTMMITAVMNKQNPACVCPVV